MKEEALDRTMWRNRFGGGFGPVVRQNTRRIKLIEWSYHRGSNDGGDGEHVGRVGITEMHTGLWKEIQ